MKNRSNYNFELKCNQNQVKELIQNYINENSFTLQNNNGEQYYRAGDVMIEGLRYFNYEINGNTLTIYAWIKSPLGVEVNLENSHLNINAMNHRNSLNRLFQEIEKLNNVGTNMDNSGMNFDPNTGKPINQNTNNTGMNFDPNTGKPINQNTNNTGMNFDPNTGKPINQSSQVASTFQKETTNKQEKMCELGFWLSLIGLLISFVGKSFGMIIYAMNITFASQGLKTRKRGKAIATIVLTVISIIISIATFFA